jgi:hypothetical protein
MTSRAAHQASLCAASVGAFLCPSVARIAGQFWFEHRTRTRALDVLRIYAERGEEPPSSVLQALASASASGWARKDDTADNRDRIGRPRTRGGFLAHAAANTVFAVGFFGFAWWRYADLGEASTGVMVSIFLGLFNAASVAAQLVGAYYTSHR